MLSLTYPQEGMDPYKQKLSRAQFPRLRGQLYPEM